MRGRCPVSGMHLKKEPLMMKGRFEDKVAVVTGASSGIGKVTAQVFAREGARVVVTTGTNVKGGEETVRLIRAAGGEASFITMRCIQGR